MTTTEWGLIIGAFSIAALYLLVVGGLYLYELWTYYGFTSHVHVGLAAVASLAHRGKRRNGRLSLIGYRFYYATHRR